MAPTCPSNLSALPDTSGFLDITQASFNRYLVATLSVASNTMSYVSVLKNICTCYNGKHYISWLKNASNYILYQRLQIVVVIMTYIVVVRIVVLYLCTKLY